MSTFGSRIAQVLPFWIALTGIAACATDVGGPDSEKLKSPEPIEPPATASMTQAVSELTVFDAEDGTQYTLNIAAQEIRMSDGRVLRLDAEQTYKAIGTFSSVIATDPVADDLATIADSCEIKCNEPFSVDPSTEDSDSSLDIIWRVVPKNRGPGRPKKTMGNAYSTPVFSFASAVVSVQQSSTCNNIASGAYQKRQEYADNRTSWIKRIWNVAVGETVGAMTKVIPTGSAAAVELNTMLYEASIVHTQVNIMAVYWNTYSCSTKTVVVNPVYQGGTPSGSGGSIANYTCVYESWQISFNNGATWDTIWVRVCGYEVS